MNKIQVYSNNTCPYCKEVKEELNKNNIEFDDLLTENNKNPWQSIVNLTGIPSVPTIYFNGEYLVPGRDFANANQLVHRIKKEEPSKFSKEERILEKLKTLNYNMGNAFNKTNQILIQIENKLKIENNEH